MKRERLDSLSERDLLIGMITSDSFCREIAPIIVPRQLEVEYARIVASWVKEYYSMYNKAPKQDISKLYRAHCDELRDEALQENVLSFIEKLSNDYERISNFNTEFALEQAVKYLKGRALKNLSEDVDSYLLSGDVDKAENAITKFKRVERNSGESASMLFNTEEIINTFTNEDSVLFQFPGAYGQIAGKFRREDFFAYVAPMKRGKCLGYGTEILMKDMTKKQVQDLRVGDRLMGPDSRARTVLTTCRGRGMLYRVRSKKVCEPNRNPIIDFVCNGDHILCLRSKYGHYKEISVNEYFTKSKAWKDRYQLYKVGIANFTRREYDIEPSVMGLYLAVLAELYADEPVEIPTEYFRGNVGQRQTLIEAILTGTPKRQINSYETATRSKTIVRFHNKWFAASFLRLIQSLGIYAWMYEDTAHVGQQWGVHYEYALDKNAQYSLYNLYEFEIDELGEGDYYGFTLDKDHRFLLGDYTVSHNTFHLAYTAETAMMNGLKVIFFSLEMSREAMIRRLWMSLSGQLYEDKDDIDIPYFELDDDGMYQVHHKTVSRKAVDVTNIEKKQKALRRLSRGGDIQVVAVPAYSLTVEALDAYLDDFEQKGYIPDVIIVDYADIMAPSEKGDYRNQLDGIWKRLRGLAQKRKALVVTASQSGRSSIDRDVDATDIAEDIRKIAHVTSMVSLNQTPQDIKNGVMKLKQLAIRDGEREFRQAICLQCLSVGKPVLDSKFEDEVYLPYMHKEEQDTEDKSSRRRR